MNRSYRHVWSAARGAYIIAAETAKSRGKSGSATRATRALAPAALGVAASFALALAPPAQAQTLGAAATTVVPAGGKANAYIAPNGVPVVNIEAANAAGISHNTFNRYDVDAKGLVLNNAPLAKSTFIQSQLAGQVVGNLNIRDSAKVILNEVVSTNRSTLAGYTEVLGGRADVIVVNPNGLTCTGCGFINTDRVTLTTGAPVWAADGSLIGFNVSRGDIDVTGAGLNANAQQILDLVARSVRIDGQLNVAANGSLGIYTGLNQWTYSGRNIAGTVASTAEKPAYAIDSTALGGMYAGRIRLIATEAGVGVRMLGDAAASGDDFRLDAAGKVLVQSRVSAARDLQIAQTGAKDAGQLEVSGANASLTAQRDLQLTLDGGATLGDAVLKAGNNLQLKAASLLDNAANNAARSANGALDVAIAGAAAIAGSTWGAGSHLAFTAASLDVGSAGATLYSGSVSGNTDRLFTIATTGDIKLDKAKLTSTDTLSLSAGGAIRATGNTELTAAQDARLAASGALDNAGSVMSGANLALDAASVANSGLLQAQGKLDLDATRATGALANSADGRVLADSIAIKAASVDNAGALQATNGLSLAASGQLANREGGLLLSTAAGKDLVLNAGSLDNAGAVQSAGSLSATIAGGTNNSGKLLTTSEQDGGSGGAIVLQTESLANSGTLAASGAATVKAAKDIVNQNLVQGAALTLQAGAAIRNSGLDSALLSRSTITVGAADIDNAGLVQAADAVTANATASLKNSNVIQAAGKDGSITLGGATVANSGTIQSGAGASVKATVDTLTNSGQILAGGSVQLAAATELRNSDSKSTVQSGADMGVQAASVVNGGALIAGKNLGVVASGAIKSSGLLQTTLAAGQLSLTGASVGNDGAVDSAGSVAFKAVERSIENQGQVKAATNLNLLAALSISNLGGGSLLTARSIVASGADFTNGGATQADGKLQVTVTGGFSNGGSFATMSTASAMDVRAASIGNEGKILAASDASFTSTTGAIRNSDQLQARGQLAFDTATVLDNSGNIIGQKDVGIGGAANFGVDNSGRIQASGDIKLGSATRVARSTSNAAGGILLADKVTLYSGILSNDGTIQADEALSLGAASLPAQATSNRGTMLGATVDLATGTLTNSGRIQADDSVAVGSDGQVAQSVSNSGTMQGASVGLFASSLSNDGRIQADGSLVLGSASRVAQSATNSGTLLGDTVGLYANNLSNSGRVQAAGQLFLGTAAQAAQTAVNSGTLFGDTIGLYANSLSNSGRIQSGGAATIKGATIRNMNQDSIILVGMDGSDASLNASTSFYNAGAVHGGGDLNVSSPRLDNTGTGGISSEGKLTMNATGNGFDNSGALYAGTTLSVNAAGQTLNNNTTGTMDATDIAIQAATFNNFNTVISLNDTSIRTTTAFNNLPTGHVPSVIVAETLYDTPVAIADWESDCLPVVHTNCDHNITWSQRFTEIQGLDGPMPTQKGQIIAGHNLSIDYGQQGVNRASLISAINTVTISGSGGFTNTDLHLDKIVSYRQWHMRKEGKVFSSDPYFWTYAASDAEFGCNDGGCFTGSASNEEAAKAAAFKLENTRTMIKEWQSGIYADRIDFSGGKLLNLGDPSKQAPKAPSAGSADTPVSAQGKVDGGSAVGTSAFAGTPFSSGFSAVIGKLSDTVKSVAVQANAPIQFKGLNLTLPTNPNGYFVTAKNPNSQYLVETNPLFGAGSNSVGSDYLSKLLNINPDKEMKRLGDANYEAKLVRDQLVAQTGNNILKGQKSEAAQMQALMDNASSQAGKLGLVFGQPLSPEQAAGLTEDMVWMVETVVGGQKVLAPVVYLAATTRDAIETGGAVIAANNLNIKADTVTNTGGTLSAGKMDITAKGDITNTGGKIKGGDVSLTSTEGSIVNQTSAKTSGGKDFSRTSIGATGSIESTGNLNLNAAKDITVKGGEVKAGGAATLAAGGNVTFDTIQDKRSDTTSQSSSGGFAGLEKNSSSTHTESVTNIGSSLTTGGNLSITSGGKTTIAGSQAKVGGDLKMDAKGGVDIVSRQDTKQTTTTSSHSGLGENGGLYGGTETTTDNFQGRNVASGLDVKGNADIKTDGTLTQQGSKIKVGGNADIKADDVQVLAGQDVDRTTTTTSKTAFLKLQKAEGDSGAEAGADAGAGVGGKSKLSIGAEAKASAQATGSGGLTLAEKETSTTTDYSKKSVASQLDIGGNLNISSNKDITLDGAKVKTGGDANLDAKGNVNILTSQDVHTTTSTTSKTQIGLYVESKNTAEAGASATAGAVSGANAKAEAKSDTTLDLARTSTTKSDSLDITNNASSIDSGGKLTINAGKKLTAVGADIGGDKGVKLNAQDQEFSAANDVHTESTTTTKSSIGFYATAGAKAEAGGSVSTGPVAGAGGAQMSMGGGSNAGASAEAKAGRGYRAATETESSSSGTTTAKVTTIRSGNGDIERTASGTITDVGTNIDAAGNFTQSATTIDSRAAQNTSYENHSSSSKEARIGAYVQAQATAGNASAEGAAAGGAPDASVSMGVEASYEQKNSSSSKSSSQAVVSNIKAGGKVSSTSSGATTLEATNISGGQGVELSAQSLDFKAAKNTETSSSSSTSINASAAVGVAIGEKGPADFSAAGGFDKSKESSSSSQAVTGNIKSGAGLSIKTQGDAHFEGVGVDAKGDASINAGGKLTMDAAHNESSSTSSSSNLQAGVAISKSSSSGKEGGSVGAGVNVAGGFENEKSSSSEAVAGKVSAGGNLTLSSGSKASFEATQLKSGGDTTVAAQSAEFKDAKNTSSSSSNNFSGSIGGGAAAHQNGKEHATGAFGVQGGFTNENQTEAVKGSTSAGGQTRVVTGAAGVQAAAAASAAPVKAVAAPKAAAVKAKPVAVKAEDAKAQTAAADAPASKG